jgi:hypothetical protein
MGRVWIAAAAVAVLLVPLALAQNEEDEGPQVGDYAPDIEAKDWVNVYSAEDIPSFAELRGMVIVLFFWTSWHDAGEYVMPMMNLLEYGPTSYRTQGLYTIGVTDADRQATEPLIKESKVFFPVAVESKAAQEYGFRQGFGFVVIGPDGKIAYKSSGTGDLNSMASAVRDLMEESPPSKTHPWEAKACYRLLDAAEDHIRDGKYPRASEAAREAITRSVLGDRLKSQALELIDLMDLLGYERFARFEPLLEQEKYEAAARLLRRIIRRFRGLDCYKDAKALYQRLQEEDEDFKLAAAGFEDEDEAARLYLEAREDLRAHRYGESYDKFQKVITEYPDTEAAEYAEGIIARMKRNHDFWLHILDHRAAPLCRELLGKARSFMGQRRYREAERLLRRVMNEYPKTIWAEQAVEELKNIPR